MSRKWRSSAREGTGILLALRAHQDLGVSVERARELALSFDEPLRLLCVLPERSLLSRLFGASSSPPSPKSDESARLWLAHELGELSAHAHIDWCRGDFAEQVALYARELSPRFVLLTDRPRSGDVAAFVAQNGRSRVLVVRGRASRNPILAATDLQDSSFPVLRAAAQLARKLQQPLITFHNVDPLSMMSGRAAMPSGVVLTGGVSAATRRDSLMRVSRELQVEPRPVIRTELDPVHAILDEAEVCDAGLIVVGAPAGSWWRRLMNDSVAEQVTNRADRDVLVTPIGESSR